MQSTRKYLQCDATRVDHYSTTIDNIIITYLTPIPKSTRMLNPILHLLMCHIKQQSQHGLDNDNDNKTANE